VNDIFMCFFFGLAIKEVTEALLPGGSLNPVRRAVNPLVATLGGVVGPAVAYLSLVSVLYVAGAFDDTMCEKDPSSGGGDHRRLGASSAPLAADGATTERCPLSTLLRGWGVPTATDISLAWMFALLIFGAGHSAINFLLLLAIVDDAIGMVIIALYYPDPASPLEPVWLLLVLLAMILAFGLRKLKVHCWPPYIFICGPISWLGLLFAHVHPALALVFVVPFMPANHAQRVRSNSVANLGACDLSPAEVEDMFQVTKVTSMTSGSFRARSVSAVWKAAELLAMQHSDHAPLHMFENTVKLPVDMGMFFFGFANAGVSLTTAGSLTVSVLAALIIGKTLGIGFASLLAAALGFGLPGGVTTVDLFAMSALGGVGLTVALFVANEAFVDPGLQSQAKFAAVLSVGAALLAKLIKCLSRVGQREPLGALQGVLPGSVDLEQEGADWIDDVLVDEILQIMWLQRRYRARGACLPLDKVMTPANSSRTSSKQVSNLPSCTNSMQLPAAFSPGTASCSLEVA